MAYKHIFGAIIDHVLNDMAIAAGDTNPDAPPSIPSIVGMLRFLEPNFFESANPKSDETSQPPKLIYESSTKKLLAGKGVLEYKVAVQCEEEGDCTAIAERLDYILTEPFRPESELPRPVPSVGNIGTIIKVDEQPIYIEGREIYETILVYRILFTI